MSQAPDDATATTQTGTAGTGTEKKDDVKQALQGFGTALKNFGNKVKTGIKNFVDETEEDVTNSKSMVGLSKMAANEFQVYINTRAKTTDKNSEIQKIADSFRFG